MWNKRRQNFLLLSEILISFVVIFALFSFLVYYFQNYRKPLGIDHNRVWSITFDNRQVSKNVDSASMFYDNLEKSLKAMPQIREVAYTSANFPFSESIMNTNMHLNDRPINSVNRYVAGFDYNKVLGMQLLEGRWFKPEDIVSNYKVIVINESLKSEAFGSQSAIGKYLNNHDKTNRLKIVGVVQDVKVAGDYLPSGKGMYIPQDTTDIKWNSFILVKVNESADANFEGQLYKFLGQSFNNERVEITYLDDLRDAKNKITVIPMIIFMIVAGFLIINVALGLFGVLWYNISRRRSEIGLRRAIGASGASVSSQLVAESLILATLSIIVGCFFALQFPLLNVFDIAADVYLYAIVLSMLFIYLLVIACSVYPGRQAAAIHPATALHEE
jgi:putative ABC transport system permease protein